MSTASDYWANAQSGSPGTMLAEMQAKLYAGGAGAAREIRSADEIRNRGEGTQDTECPHALDMVQGQQQSLQWCWRQRSS